MELGHVVSRIKGLRPNLGLIKDLGSKTQSGLNPLVEQGQ